MSDRATQNAAAQDAPPAPAQDGGTGGGTGAAEVEPISHNGPMACHIGHISPQHQDGSMSIEIWAKHVRIKRPCHVIPARPSLRGKVDGLSPRASRRLRWAIENTPDLTAVGAHFICLTYPAEWPKDGRTVKRHLDSFGKRARRVGAFFAWALEYQSRGAPHFHLLARFPENWDVAAVREWVASSWFEVVGSGDEKHLHAGTSAEVVSNPECAGWYIAHYLGKEYQKTPPEGVTLPGRMWGMIGCKPPEPEVLHFREGCRDGISLLRNIRRWAASDHAFRQRGHVATVAERKRFAMLCRHSQPDMAALLLNFKHVTLTFEFSVDERKAWSPRDPGREKGYSVRNAAKMASQYLEMTAPPS